MPREIRAPGLAGWLAVATAVLVTVAVTAVSAAGIRLLRGLAEANALTRVELAVAAAREGLRQSEEDLSTAARVLAERPTLQRLLRESNLEAVMPYLQRYCEGAVLDACAVSSGGAVVASIGDELPWERVLASAAEQGEHFLVTGATPRHAFGGASAAVAGDDGASVLTLRRLDRAFAERLSERAGLEIRIAGFASLAAGEGPLAVLNSDALSRGAPATGYVEALDAYAASLPVAAATGEPIALLQAVLPAGQALEPVTELTRRMLGIAVGVALLATTSGIVIGRHWIGGVHRLTSAARRIGVGDLAASIPEESGKELGVLAATMEEMRRNLVALTSELRRREAEAQAVVGGIVEGIFAVDRERRIRFLNPQAEKLLKVSAEEAMGRFCGDVLKPAVDADGRRPCERDCPIVKAQASGSADAIELVEPVAGRVRRVVIASAAPADGMQVQVLRDETELEAVRRTRDTVLANISHEFRTPLAAQLASIEILHDGLGIMTLEQQRQVVESLERGAQRLTWLIDNLLESVRIEAGQLAIRRQPIDLGEIVQAARDLVEPLIEQRGQVLEVSLDELPQIRGDRQRLVQVLVNLLANASKFGPRSSVIAVGARATSSGGIAFWVDDAGPGPADPDDAALFEQFRRAGGEDPRESGLGLGLFIVRSIVERHGGRVRLCRTAEAATRAEVVLPGDIPS
jgi:signal transduction histidine kinase